MYSHIKYEYSQQYHRDLLQQAARSRLARQSILAKSRQPSRVLVQALSQAGSRLINELSWGLRALQNHRTKTPKSLDCSSQCYWA